MLRIGQMEDSISPWNFPIFVIPKPDGRWRLVTDYRLLNQRTKRIEWPMPDTQQYIDSLSGMQWFASIDLKDAFFQILVKRNIENILPSVRALVTYNTLLCRKVSAIALRPSNVS